MNLECEIRFTNSANDYLLTPIPRDIINKNISPHEIQVLPPYKNQFKIVNLNPNQDYKFNFFIPTLPTEPPKDLEFLNQCLANNERYTKWSTENLGHKILSSEVTDKSIAMKIGMFIKGKFKYSRNRDNYKYIDELLFQSTDSHPLQDCLGYHSAFVGCLRSIGIPAVLDIGFRLSGQDKPHTWAWYFDRQEKSWIWVDLNDNKHKVMFGPKGLPRVSMTLGTTHVVKNIPNFSDSIVSFIQYGLGKRRIENTPPFTQATFTVSNSL